MAGVLLTVVIIHAFPGVGFISLFLVPVLAPVTALLLQQQAKRFVAEGPYECWGLAPPAAEGVHTDPRPRATPVASGHGDAVK
jgi:hypothetical protein